MRPAVVTFREARPADAPTMARTVALCFDTYRAFGPPRWHPPDAAGPHPLAARLDTRGAWALLADVAGEPAGHVALFPEPGDRERTAYLWQLFVRPAWWGTGLAGELHEAFIDRARASGFRRARLMTPAAHARARRFYARRGWRTDGPPALGTDFRMPLVTLRRSLLD